MLNSWLGSRERRKEWLEQEHPRIIAVVSLSEIE
jgi:hypothetical protein